MTLPAAGLAALRSALSDNGMGESVTYRLPTQGGYGEPLALTVCISDDVETQERSDHGLLMRVRTVIMRPLAAVSVALGARVTWQGVDFVLIAAAGAHVPRWTCVWKDTIGAQRKDGFRAVGGGP